MIRICASLLLRAEKSIRLNWRWFGADVNQQVSLRQLRLQSLSGFSGQLMTSSLVQEKTNSSLQL